MIAGGVIWLVVVRRRHGTFARPGTAAQPAPAPRLNTQAPRSIPPSIGITAPVR